MILRRLLLAALLSTAPLLPVPLQALPPAEAEAGRAIVQRHAAAVVEVELVAKLDITLNDKVQPPREIKRTANATVIAPTGLTVLSLRSIDPRSAVPRMPNLKTGEPEYKEVKLRLADDTEIPAKLVLMDEDLDLAFVAPEPALPERPFAFVDLDDPAKAEVLGTYYDLARAGKHLQRTPAIRSVYAIGLVEKPRQLVLLSDYATGCPVFDADGKLLGISVRHMADGRDTGMILLPAASIAEIAPR